MFLEITAVIHPFIMVASCGRLTLAWYQLSLKPFYHSLPQLDRWICSTTGCREISALVPRTPAPSHSSLTLLSAELFPSWILSCHCCCLLCRWDFFIPSLKILSQRHSHRSRWVRGGSILEPHGIGSIRHSRTLWQLPTENTPGAL